MTQLIKRKAMTRFSEWHKNELSFASHEMGKSRLFPYGILNKNKYDWFKIYFTKYFYESDFLSIKLQICTESR